MGNAGMVKFSTCSFFNSHIRQTGKPGWHKTFFAKQTPSLKNKKLSGKGRGCSISETSREIIYSNQS